MNFVFLAFGILLIGTGFVTLIHKVHDRSMHESLALLRNAHGDTARAVGGFVSLLVPIVSSIVTGLAILGVAAALHH
jgi:hypothetical protein